MVYEMTDRDKMAIELGMPIKLMIPGVPDLYIRKITDVGPIIRTMYPDVKFEAKDLRRCKE